MTVDRETKKQGLPYNYINRAACPINILLCINDIMNQSYFGNLVYSEQLSWYSTTFKVDGYTIDMSISGREESTDFDSAETLVVNLLQKISQVHEYISNEMYEIYRKEWANLLFKASKTKFKRSINLNSIVVFVTGDLDMYFSDSGLFKGHDVVVRYSINRGFYNCRLTG